MSAHKLPFTGESKDYLFGKVKDSFSQTGVPFPKQRMLPVIYREVCKHMKQAADLCGHFWKYLKESDKVDITQPESSFYRLVFARAGNHPGACSEEILEGDLSSSIKAMPEEIKVAMNHFFNEMIRHLRAASKPA